MPAIIAIVRKGWRLVKGRSPWAKSEQPGEAEHGTSWFRLRRAVLTAVLTLAVLLGASGIHTTTHCAEHGQDSPVLVVDLDAPEGGQDGEDGLCLSCDCGCQPVIWHEPVTLVQPAVQSARLHRGPGQLTPDDVVFEIEPPPVLAA